MRLEGDANRVRKKAATVCSLLGWCSSLPGPKGPEDQNSQGISYQHLLSELTEATMTQHTTGRIRQTRRCRRNDQVCRKGCFILLVLTRLKSKQSMAGTTLPCSSLQRPDNVANKIGFLDELPILQSSDAKQTIYPGAHSPKVSIYQDKKDNFNKFQSIRQATLVDGKP